MLKDSFWILQCNKKAKRSDVVLLYARVLTAVDTSEQERLKRYTPVYTSLGKFIFVPNAETKGCLSSKPGPPSCSGGLTCAVIKQNGLVSK